MIDRLMCPSCGATLSLNAAPGSMGRCEYCGTTFRIPTDWTPEPAMGALLLGADFADPKVPGWRIVDPGRVSFNKIPTPELVAKYPKSDLIHPVIRTPGHFDDFDISVSIRFLKSAYDYASAGLELRSSAGGDYVIRISPQGTYQLGWHDKTDWGGTLQSWSTHPDLHTKFGESNRLRVTMHGPKIRIYLNGVLATATHDNRFHAGYARVVVAPSKHGSIQVAFANLQLRHPPNG